MIYRFTHEIQFLDDDALEELLDIIQTELQERKKNEREKIKRQYQEELNRMLEAMAGDDFYVNFPDYPSNGLTVIDRKDVTNS